MTFDTLERGQRLDLFSEQELRSCTRSHLRGHADQLYRTLGSTTSAPPNSSSEDITDWILLAQRHLEASSRPEVRNPGLAPLKVLECSPRRVRSEADIRMTEADSKRPIQDFWTPDDRLRPENVRAAFGRSPMDRDGKQTELMPHERSCFSLGPDPVDQPGPCADGGKGAVISEAHSGQAEQLVRRHPLLSALITRNVQQALRHFHDGLYGGDLEIAQQKLADNVFRQLEEDKDGSRDLRESFLNLSVAVGAMAYAGNISAFCYKFDCPPRGRCGSVPAWVTVFFTLRELETVREHERECDRESGYERKCERQRNCVPFGGLDCAGRQAASDRPRERERELERQVPDRDRGQDAEHQRSRIPECERERLLAVDAIAERTRERELAAERQRILASKSPRSGAREKELQRLDHSSLCERAEVLYRDLGGERGGLRAPDVGDNLVAWILRAEWRCKELAEPEPPRSARAITSSRPSARGDVRDTANNRIGMDKYGDEIRTLNAALVDEGTTHRVKQTFGEKVTARPEKSPLDLFSERLNETLRSVSPRRPVDSSAHRGDIADIAPTDRFGDRVETKQHKDALSDETATRMTDRYGDDNMRTVKDRYGDDVYGRSVRDRYGDEINTHIMEGRHSDEIITCTARYRYGDEATKRTVRDRYCDEAVRTVTDRHGDELSPVITRDSSGDLWGANIHHPPRPSAATWDPAVQDSGKPKTFQERLETFSTAGNSRPFRDDPLWQRGGRGFS